MTFVLKYNAKARQVSLLCLLLAGVTFFPAAAQAQDVQARLTRLENEIQTLSRALFKGEDIPPGAFAADTGSAVSAQQLAAMQVQLAQFEGEIQSLTGRLEEQGHEIRRLQASFDQTVADMQMRLTALEQKQAAAPMAPTATPQDTAALPQPQTQAQTPAQTSTLTGPDTTAVPAASAPTSAADNAAAPGATARSLGALAQGTDGALSASNADPASLYESSYAFLRDKNYPAAEMGFVDFLDKYPDHALAANASYWLGESHYVRGDYTKAARVFAESYQKYPKGPKGADNLLKLALSLNSMGKTQDACIALRQLKVEYPAGSSAVLARADQEIKALGCS